jgi:ribosome modulation factor
LGGHIDACPRCGYQAALSYNSCRNRHCPKCQTQARQRWLAARERDPLATDYFHVVFTVPHELNVLALDNQRLFYDLLFNASAETLLEDVVGRKGREACLVEEPRPLVEAPVERVHLVIMKHSDRMVGNPKCAGINRHVVGDERALQERSRP